MNGGLENLGNTCGINTLIQCISYCGCLKRCLLGQNTTHGILAHELKDVVKLIAVDKASVTPRGLITRIYETFKGHLAPFEQHDISELWMLFADKVAEEVGVSYAKPSKRIEATIHKQNSGKTSDWLKNIQGLSGNIIRCKCCNHMLTNNETFNMISIDIPATEHVRLGDLIVKYISIEQLTDYKCDKCQSTECFKQIHLERLPNVLIILLKRFRMTSTGHFEKIKTPVDIVDRLTIDGTEYHLKAMGNHFGNYYGGHYTALCRTDEGKWCHHDDMGCAEVPNNFFGKNQNVYAMFYERV
jgi:ubiquitin C-terminal hydrolase